MEQFPLWMARNPASSSGIQGVWLLSPREQQGDLIFTWVQSLWADSAAAALQESCLDHHGSLQYWWVYSVKVLTRYLQKTCRTCRVLGIVVDDFTYSSCSPHDNTMSLRAISLLYTKAAETVKYGCPHAVLVSALTWPKTEPLKFPQIRALGGQAPCFPLVLYQWSDSVTLRVGCLLFLSWSGSILLFRMPALLLHVQKFPHLAALLGMCCH
jgi:hypothetical protein